MDFSDQRLSYEKGFLTKKDLPADPITLLKQWLQTAIDQKVPEPYAMSLSTCGNDNMPSARIVLMRELNEDGVVFYTNYNSDKGLDIEDNPQAEVLFFWHELERQVRLRGQVSKVDAVQSNDYFHKRPHDSQVAAWVSNPQSGVVANRDSIDDKFADLKKQYPDGSIVPRPDFWGGYQITATQIEFWQGRPNRIHDRLLYRKHDNNQQSQIKNSEALWTIERLLP